MIKLLLLILIILNFQGLYDKAIAMVFKPGNLRHQID